jgi:cyclopropane fatty-acyl-phospholipid synthase-like methyltransferase
MMAGGFTERLFAAAAITADDRLLDIGCGTGRTTHIAARHAARGSGWHWPDWIARS